MQNKKIGAIISCLMICFAIWLIPATGTLLMANDDVQDPVVPVAFYISTAEDLDAVSQAINAGEFEETREFILTTDIIYNPGRFDSDGNYIPDDDESLRVFTPIGTTENPFRAKFDGNSRKIIGLYVDGGDYAGLIGVAEFATVKNVEVAFSYISGNNYVGGVVGYSYASKYENLSIYDTQVKGNNNVGEIVGINVTKEEISTVEDLNNLAEYVNNGGITTGLTYILTKDLVINDIRFTKNGDYSSLTTTIPIGNNEHSFTGIFDGNGHKISGLYMDSKKLEESGYENEGIGLFGSISDATIKNLVIENAYISGESYLSVVCGYSKGSTLQNVSVNTSYITGEMIIGGIVASASQTSSTSVDDLKNSYIDNCYFNGTITGHVTIGGIVGSAYYISLNYPLNIQNCYSNAEIEFTENNVGNNNQYIGGIIGSGKCIKVLNCTNNTKIESLKNDQNFNYSSNIGGIVGEGRSVIVESCHNKAYISGFSRIGGIIGSGTEEININNSINNGEISGSLEIGGIAGSIGATYYDDYSMIYKCYNYGDIYGENIFGGICGIGTNIESCYAQCKITFRVVEIPDEDEEDDEYNDFYSGNIGGILGMSLDEEFKQNGEYITRVYTLNSNEFSGTITINHTDKVNKVGAIAGYLENTNVINTGAEGIINAYSDYVGGLVGYLKSGKIGNSYSSVVINEINSVNYGGGLVGYAEDSTLENSFALKMVNATEYYGVMAGYVSNCTISDLYYPDYITIRAINNTDYTEERVTSVNYSKFINEDEDSIVNILNKKAFEIEEYKTWGYGDEHPVYIVITAKLYYDLNGGMGIFTDENIYILNDIITINFDIIPYKQNYTFAGYILNDDYSVIYDSNNNTIILSEEVNILTAIWEENIIYGIYIQELTENDRIEYVYDGAEHGITVQGTIDDDIILYSSDGITYTDNEIKYIIPGTYTIYYRVQRNEYFDYISYVSFTINKIDLDLSELSWQREWYVSYLGDNQTEEIVDNKFTYNSYENKISLIEHTIPESVLEYRYFVNNQEVANFICKESGYYTITAYIVYDEEIYNRIDNYIVFSFEIEKITVIKPIPVYEQNTYEYTGSVITYEFADYNEDMLGSSYTITGNQNTDSGEYVVTISLNDTANFKWNDGTNSTIVYSYSITKKEIAVPSVQYTQFTYDGQGHNLTFTTSSDVWAVLNNNENINVGTYSVVVYLRDTKNYKFLGTDNTNIIFTMEITPRSIEIPRISNTKFTYDGREKKLGIENTTYYTVLNSTAMVAGKYVAIITLKDKINTVWQDNTTADRNIEYEIGKKYIQKPSATQEFTYTGLEQKMEFPVNNDYIVYNNTRTNTGSQNVVVTLIDKANTCWSDDTYEDLVYILTINPAKMQAISKNDIVVELVEDELITNIGSLVLNGAKVLYSLTQDGEYTETLEIDRDGEYTIYYKVILANYQDLTGTFTVVRDLDSDDDNGGNPFVIILLLLILAGGIFTYVCYTKKLLFFKPKQATETTKEDKRLAFEKNETPDATQTNKTDKKQEMLIKRESRDNKLIGDMNEDIEKLMANKNNKNKFIKDREEGISTEEENTEELTEKHESEENIENTQSETDTHTDENSDIPEYTENTDEEKELSDEQGNKDVETEQNAETDEDKDVETEQNAETDEDKDVDAEEEDVEPDSENIVQEEVQEQTEEYDNKDNSKKKSKFMDKISSITKKNKKDISPDATTVNVRAIDEDDDEM